MTRSRTAEIFTQLQQQVFQQTDRLFAVLMAAQWVFGVGARALDFAADVGRHDERRPPTRLGGDLPRRRDQRVADRAGLIRAPGSAITRYAIADRADADLGAADPPDRRPDRNALPRLRLAGVPGVLPRLAGPRSRPPSSSPATICSAGSSGRSRSTACWPPASGASSSTPAGSCSRTSCSSSRACAARGSSGASPSARRSSRPARSATARSSNRSAEGIVVFDAGTRGIARVQPGVPPAPAVRTPAPIAGTDGRRVDAAGERRRSTTSIERLLADGQPLIGRAHAAPLRRRVDRSGVQSQPHGLRRRARRSAPSSATSPSGSGSKRSSRGRATRRSSPRGSSRSSWRT